METKLVTRKSPSPRPHFYAPALPAIAATLAPRCRQRSPRICPVPATLQDFENSYNGIETRMADIFAAGYGAVYTPPPGRADSGNQSVGYDQYDRFDFGSTGNRHSTAPRRACALSSASASRRAELRPRPRLEPQRICARPGTSGVLRRRRISRLCDNRKLAIPTTGHNTKGYNDTDGDYHGAFETGDQKCASPG